MNQCCSRTSKCCLSGASNEAQNHGETNGQTVFFSSANETVTTSLMTNINRTETSNEAQKQDESNGQSANENVTTPLMN